MTGILFWKGYDDICCCCFYKNIPSEDLELENMNGMPDIRIYARNKLKTAKMIKDFLEFQ